MWLITSVVAAAAVTVLWRMMPDNRYRPDALAIMLWGLGLMVLIDHILGYEGGPFFELHIEGLVTNGVVLGILMLVPVIAIWAIYLVLTKRKEIPVKE